MTNELPYFPFYARDWIAGTRGLSAAARGAWIDILAYLWCRSKTRGRERNAAESWERALSMSEEETKRIFAELKNLDICEITDHSDGSIEIKSRRMCRDAADIQAGAKARSAQASIAAQMRWAELRKAKEAGRIPSRKKKSGALREHALSSAQTMPNDAIPESEAESEAEGEIGNRALRSAKPIPTLKEARDFAACHGLDPEVTEIWWNEREGDGWLRVKGKWTCNLTSYCLKWNANVAERRGRERERDRDRHSNPAPQKPFSEMTDEEIIRASQ